MRRSRSSTLLIIRDPEVRSVGVARFRTEKAHGKSSMSQFKGQLGTQRHTCSRHLELSSSSPTVLVRCTSYR